MEILEMAREGLFDTATSQLIRNAAADASNVEDKAWEIVLRMATTVSPREMHLPLDAMFQMAFQTADAFQQYADNKAWADLIPHDQLKAVMTEASKLKGNGS